jgi:hypothetical protein
VFHRIRERRGSAGEQAVGLRPVCFLSLACALLDLNFEVSNMSKTLNRLVFAVGMMAAPLVMVGCAEGEKPAPAMPPPAETTPAAAPAETKTGEGAAPAPAPAPAPAEAPK